MSDYIKQVEELMKLPQSLCKMCGKCCRIATYKDGLSYEEILLLTNNENEEPSQRTGAIDFLSIFVPYESLDDARNAAPEFVESVLDYFGDTANPTFFHCKYITDDNKCSIHETRPNLCKAYPIPHYRTFYNPGCGYEKMGKENWEKILEIIKHLQEQENQQ